MMKNILMMYEGGGYDGCIWEWNACFWDENGEWHDIGSSGTMGINTEKEAIERKDESSLFDVTNHADVEQFQKEFNQSLVVSITRKLNEEHNCSMWFKCDECGRETEEGIATDYEGCGGIMTQATGMVCEECCSMYLCQKCGEYVGSKGMAEKYEFERCQKYSDENDGPMCRDCLESQIENEFNEEEEEKAFVDYLQGKYWFDAVRDYGLNLI